MASEDYKFVSEPNRDYFCPVSFELLLNPHKTDCCGRHISSSAAKRLAVENKPCPMCETPSGTKPGESNEIASVFTTKSDPDFQESVLDLKVRCSYDGCNWAGTLRDVKYHSTSCGLRPWTCQRCTLKTTYNIGMSEHAPKCLEHSVQHSSSSSVGPNSDNEACTSKLLSCEFAEAGCRALIHQNDYSHHMKENFSHHHLLVSQLNLKITKEIHSKLDFEREAALKQEISQLQSELAEKNADIYRFQKELKILREQTNRDRKTAIDHDKGAGAAGPSDQDNNSSYQLDDNYFTWQHDTPDSNIEAAAPKNEKGSENRVNNVECTDDERNPGATTVPNVPRVYVKPEIDEFVPPAAVPDGTNYRNFQGLLEKVLIRGLNETWGLAIAQNVIFVVDSHKKGGVIRQATLDGSSDVVVPGINLQAPRGLALDKDMNIIVVDSKAHQVFKFTRDGTLLAASGSVRGVNFGEYNSPTGVAIDRNERIFVCDRLNHRIQILNKNLVVENVFGEMGTGLLQFTYPWAVAFDSHGNLYIADCGNRCVKVYTPNLDQVLRVLGKGQQNQTHNPGDLRAPIGLCLDNYNNLYVIDRGLSCVMVYNYVGQFIMSFGNFMEPNAVCVDAWGHVYVSMNGQDAGAVRQFFKFKGDGRVAVYT